MNDNTSDDIQSVQGTTPDFKTEFAKQLSELAPELVADGKIDSKKLKEMLDGDEADDSERFGLFWPGKKRAMRAAQEPTTATLKPAKEESKDWDTTQNLFIEGDNLEVLKVLQKHYHNKIKMIYIDPPYNTGKDFVYPDNYKEGLASYLEFTKQVDTEGRKVSTNSDTDGRYHSNWLNMIYPRLKLARNLLKSDGVVFISIDDNEQDNLRKVCNEIFGESNFVASFIWKSRQNKDNRNISGVSVDHEYVVCYSRTSGIRAVKGEERKVSQYSNPDNDPRGDWTSGNMAGLLSADQRPNCHYDLIDPATNINYGKPKMGWRYDMNTMTRLISENRILWPDNPNGRPRKKVFLDELSEELPGYSSIIGKDVYTRNGTAEIVKLFDGKKYFDFPKPTTLLFELIEQCTEDGDIVMDLFAGSGTTGHSVMALNAERDTNRIHIQIQIPEPLDKKSEAYRDGYRSIADIAKDRLRRASDNIKKDIDSKTVIRENLLDLGFKVYKLSESNFTKWHSASDTDKDSLQQHLLNIRESSNDAATEEDLLTEVLLKQGISLTASIAHSDVEGLSVWTVGDNLVCAYLNESQVPTLDQLRAVAAKEPAKLIILEDAFKGDDELKTNLVQICKSQKIELWTV